MEIRWKLRFEVVATHPCTDLGIPEEVEEKEELKNLL